MYINHKNTQVYYEIKGKKGGFIVFLHGWGAGSETLFPLAKNFRNSRLIFIDFPPFSKSDEPTSPWTIFDYADLIKKILNKHKIKKIKIIAHSFGGRVAILLASQYNIVESLVLISGAGLKMRKNLAQKFKIWRYKTLKKHGKIMKNAGSIEYQVLSQVMKQTFVNVVNQNLEDYAKKITCKTRLIYGKKDKATPPYMAKKMHKLIAGSELCFVKNAGHFVWLDNMPKILDLLDF